MWEICFFVNERRVCIPIPILVPWRWWRWPPNPPDPPWHEIEKWIEVDTPDPCPWKRDLTILATVDQLVAHAETPAVRELSGIARQAAQELSQTLPEGAELEIAEMRPA